MKRLREKSGIALIWTAIAMLVLVAFVGLAVDMGLMVWTAQQLQIGADAGALASVQLVNFDEELAKDAAVNTAGANKAGGALIQLDRNADVEPGQYDRGTSSFSAGVQPYNAVRVTARRTTGSPAGALPLAFAKVMGFDTTDIQRRAIAMIGGEGPSTRFLIDDEMIDSDIPEIEELADSLNMDPEDIIDDNNGDWFIDLPPGTIIELPTGQEGDEALFDVDHPAFIFQQNSNPSLEDFLNWNEDGSWRQDLFDKELLDPLLGVSRVDDPANYPDYVSQTHIHVSPVFKSDASALNPVSDGDNGTIPAVNALGLRRGLLAFKIIGIGIDPPGSPLPYIIIEVVDGSTINLAELEVGETSGDKGFLVE